MAGGQSRADVFGGLDGAGVGEGFGDAGLEQFVEQGFLAVERAEARTHNLADRGVAARLDALVRGAGERAESDGDGLFGAGCHAGSPMTLSYHELVVGVKLLGHSQE